MNAFPTYPTLPAGRRIWWIQFYPDRESFDLAASIGGGSTMLVGGALCLGDTLTEVITSIPGDRIDPKWIVRAGILGLHGQRALDAWQAQQPEDKRYVGIGADGKPYSSLLERTEASAMKDLLDLAPSVWWNSFVDEETGAFKGVSIVRGVTTWDAIKVSHDLGCNPGGGVMQMPLAPDLDGIVADHYMNRLLTADEATQVTGLIDAALEGTPLPGETAH